MNKYTDTILTIVKYKDEEPEVMVEPMLFNTYVAATNFLLDVYYEDGIWGCRMQKSNEDSTQHMFEFQKVNDDSIVHKIYVSVKENRNEHMVDMIIFNNTENE